MICFLAMFRLFDMYDYSNHAPLIILLGVISVCLGYAVGSKYKIKGLDSIPIIGIKQDTNYVMRERLYIVFLCSSIAVYIILLIAVISLYRHGYGASTIREFYRYSGETSSSGLATELIYGGSSILRWLHTYYANAIVYMSIPIMVIDLNTKAKITKISLLAIVALGLSCLVNFGRFNLLYSVTCLLVAYFMKGKKISKKTKRRIIYATSFSILAIIILFLIVNGMRNTTSEISFLEHFYAYFSIEIPLLDYWINYVRSNNCYSYGFSFVSGLVANMMNVLAKHGIFFSAYRVNELFNYNLVDHFVHVFPKQKHNAYVSMFFAFYLDFREPGVLVGSMLYGFTVAKSYNKSKYNNVSLALYFLLFYSLLTSFIRWQFILVSYCFSFIFLRILFKRDIPTFQENNP